MRLAAAGTLGIVLTVGQALTRADSPCVEVDALQALQHEKVVIVAEVVSATPSDRKGKAVQLSEAVRALYQVRVLEEFKGSRLKQYALLGDLPRQPAPPGLVYLGDEGLPLIVGRKYLLFAWGDPLKIDPCPPTAPLSEASKALALLRQRVQSRDR